MLRVAPGLEQASRGFSSIALKYKEHGVPEKVLSLEEHTISDLKDTEVHAELVAAPLNPSDINQVTCRSHVSCLLCLNLERNRDLVRVP